MTINVPTANGIESLDDVLRSARREAYHLGEQQLVHCLKEILGRPLIAHITGIADADKTYRWRLAASVLIDPWTANRRDTAYRVQCDRGLAEKCRPVVYWRQSGS